MLIYSKDRLMPSNINMMVLQGAEGGYYYIHRSLYDQAVILEDRYKDNTDALLRGLGKDPEEYLPLNVCTFRDNVPRPINILAYFLLLIDDIATTRETVEVLCGAIHVMSSIVNFRQFLKIPKETRASVSFSLSIREEYEVSWDRFFQEALPYGAQIPVRTNYTVPKVTLDTAETDEDFLALLDEDLEIDLTTSPDDIQEPEEEPQERKAPLQTEERKSTVIGRLKGM